MMANRVIRTLLPPTSKGFSHRLRCNGPGLALKTARGVASQSVAPRSPRLGEAVVTNKNKIYPTHEESKYGKKLTHFPALVSENSIKVQRYNSKAQEEYWQAISPRWLRDHCRCADCMNQDTSQRQINVLKGGIDCKIRTVKDLENDEMFQITFEDGHVTSIPKNMLVERDISLEQSRHGMAKTRTWQASIADQPPSVQYEEVQKSGLGEALRNMRELGFCFVENMPPTADATQTLLEAIGPIRNTHYGGFYDFTADLSSKDTAYTSEHLEPHNDNTYFTEAAGLQALHLLSHTEGSGGESSLVDGFEAARQLFHQDREAYRILGKVGVYGHASGNEGISIQPAEAAPILNHHRGMGSLMQVRWNNADRAGLDCSVRDFDAWYDAAEKFDAILSDPKNQYWFQLTPGKLLIFDNWRVLHGRAAFTGKRRMCGGYINRDDYISKYRQTNLSKDEIVMSTVTG